MKDTCCCTHSWLPSCFIHVAARIHGCQCLCVAGHIHCCYRPTHSLLLQTDAPTHAPTHSLLLQTDAPNSCVLLHLRGCTYSWLPVHVRCFTHLLLRQIVAVKSGVLLYMCCGTHSWLPSYMLLHTFMAASASVFLDTLIAARDSCCKIPVSCITYVAAHIQDSLGS